MKNTAPYSSLAKRLYVLGISFGCALAGVLLLLLFYARGNALAFAKNPTRSMGADVTGTTASTVFLPSLQDNSPFVYSLGTVHIISGPTNTNGLIYYDLRVGCPRISRSIDAEIKVGEPLAAPVKGTIFFATGWDGTYYWAGDEGQLSESIKSTFAKQGIQIERILSNNSDIINHLRADGYRTVQLKWMSNWWEAELSHPEGFASLACRPATVMRWIYDNLHQQKGSAPYCATGHSNGASQVGFAITHYGLSDILSSVVFESGPNWSRVDVSCLHDHPNLSSLFENENGREIIDWGFGFPIQHTGACDTQDSSYHITFASASLTYGSSNRQYFPHTDLEFLFGKLDTGTTALNGKYFYDYLVNWNNPIIHRLDVEGTDHGVTETDAGMQAMESTLRSSCVLR